MQEISCQVVLSFLKLFLGHVSLLENGDVKSVFLALEEVSVEEVHDLRTILPGPCTE